MGSNFFFGLARWLLHVQKTKKALPYKSKHEMLHLQISGECIANAPRWEMEDRIQITYLSHGK